MLAVESGTVIEGISWEENPGPDGEPEITVIARVRPHRRRAGRCGICGRRCPGYDQGERRRWRALDLGAIRAELEGAAPRVSCPGHSVTVAAVPWARHGARHTRAFEDTIAWLALRGLQGHHLRADAHRVADHRAHHHPGRHRGLPPAPTGWPGCGGSGSTRSPTARATKYLVIVVDHDTGLLIWAAPGRTMKTVASFFDALGPDRTAALTHVSADGASYIATVVSARAPAAIQCTDPFHVVSWAAEALKPGPPRSLAGRRPARRQRPAPPRPPASSSHRQGDARSLKRTRYALWKNPDNLTDRQQAKLAWIEKTHPYLYRAWLLKEGMRVIFASKASQKPPAKPSPDGSSGPPAAASRNSSSSADKSASARPASWPPSTTSVSNGLIESVNTKVRLITRVAYGFHGPQALIALAMLSLGGQRPALPGR